MSCTEDDPVVLKNFLGHKKDITSVKFHPEELKVATSSLDKSFIIYNFNNNSRCNRYVGHTEAINDIDYAPSGELVATASQDRTVRVWVPKVRGESLGFRAHTSAVRSVQFSSDGKEVLVYLFLIILAN